MLLGSLVRSCPVVEAHRCFTFGSVVSTQQWHRLGSHTLSAALRWRRALCSGGRRHTLSDVSDDPRFVNLSRWPDSGKAEAGAEVTDSSARGAK
jgi:hypothetical protein